MNTYLKRYHNDSITCIVIILKHMKSDEYVNKQNVTPENELICISLMTAIQVEEIKFYFFDQAKKYRNMNINLLLIY